MYFNRWIEAASNFQDDFKRNYEIQRYVQSSFMLHQATERFFMCLLLVYTGYKPKIHDLEKLDKQARELDVRFKDVFPRSTQEEARLFNLLKKAYIDSRYKLDFNITKEELEYLAERVQKLKDLTEMACKEKIESFG